MAGIGFRQQGHQVTILEKSHLASEVGAAIHLAPNSSVLLERAGLSPKEFGGTLLERMEKRTSSDECDFAQEFAEARKGWQAEWYLVHRVDLHSALKAAATSRGSDGNGSPAQLLTGSAVASVDAATATVVLEDGRTLQGDVVLGADGVHSKTRQHAAPGARPVPSGKSCFRWLLPRAALRADAATNTVAAQTGTMIEWASADRRVIMYPCSGNTLMNFAAFVPDEEVAGGAEAVGGGSWSQTADKSAMLACFKDFAPGVQRLLEMAPEGNLKVWRMLDMPDLGGWTNERFALLGDAAHPFMPYLGQGGAIAIEDAASLAALFPLGTQRSEVAERLQLYETCRKERADRIRHFTRLNGRDPSGKQGPRPSGEEAMAFLRYAISHDEGEYSSSMLEEHLRVRSSL
ncbi:uncharacterized protein K452DRAFT_287909 [Aplosporella prunicola CBS 121167]|uniref:FAD-binding domain-containing protein n=1 Tax=Aplosporella prunicola CBS 121167 TaxID=1176127 RepID=A0A6A6BAH0_9PEZI|nr:uncharacterized protein K452DRAFT_287909 [Aplosporella prunicola CBS 121167]KAF2141199.1 hypothetical protein K452DRAFT_287909 [Aplosporella prunicola CBS 121167]